jgi:hypothetical protein
VANLRRKKRDDGDTRRDRVEDIAQSYPDAYLACRDIGHSWRPLTASWTADGNIHRRLQCVRCHVERAQILDAQGYILSGTYAYADGYQSHGVGGLNRDDRAQLRKANVLRGLQP